MAGKQKEDEEAGPDPSEVRARKGVASREGLPVLLRGKAQLLHIVGGCHMELWSPGHILRRHVHTVKFEIQVGFQRRKTG